MSEPVILYRQEGDLSDEELLAMSEVFVCTDSRMDIRPGNLVVGRYSVLPYYREPERDVRKAGARLINSYQEHSYVADCRMWAEDLEGLTPRCWSADGGYAELPDGVSFVVKGATNSRKFLWDTHMFAKDRAAAIQVGLRLMNDSLIGQQPIVVREYVPLKTLAYGPHGLPITVEFRVFVCHGQVLSKGYYWSSHVADLPAVPSADDIPAGFLRDVIECVADRVPFFSVDVAQTEDGRWIVVELNDGQMSGLSENDPAVLYPALRRVLARGEEVTRP